MPGSIPLPAGSDAPAIFPFRYAEFRLEEKKDWPSDDERLGSVRAHLRATWPVRTDIFVTGDLPLLLTRVALTTRVGRCDLSEPCD